jgi:hypothetical protein
MNTVYDLMAATFALGILVGVFISTLVSTLNNIAWTYISKYKFLYNYLSK